MKVLVDTPIWSLALRRKKQDRNPEENLLAAELTELIREDRAVIIGPIRQEILSGIASKLQFEKLKAKLKAFRDVKIILEDYEGAASFYNQCRQKGVQGSHIDFLLCAVASRNDFSIFTTDRDFDLYARHLDISLFKALIQ